MTVSLPPAIRTGASERRTIGRQGENRESFPFPFRASPGTASPLRVVIFLMMWIIAVPGQGEYIGEQNGK
jgi:hypothetical protein